MNLITIKEGRLTISTEAAYIKSFRTMFNRDRTKLKDEYIDACAYIYFMTDPRSDYAYLTDDVERDKAIVETEGIHKLKKDSVFKEAMSVYKEHCKSTATESLSDTKIALDKLRSLLRNADFEKLDKNDKPIYTPQALASTIEKVIGLAVQVSDAEKKIFKDIGEDFDARGKSTKGVLDDGLDILLQR